VDFAAKAMEHKRALPRQERTGVSFPRYSRPVEAGRAPYDELEWELRSATIANDKGAIIFEQRDVEVPSSWSQTATNIVASKYFHGRLGSLERERRRVPTGSPGGGYHRTGASPTATSGRPRTPRTSVTNWPTCR